MILVPCSVVRLGSVRCITRADVRPTLFATLTSAPCKPSSSRHLISRCSRDESSPIVSCKSRSLTPAKKTPGFWRSSRQKQHCLFFDCRLRVNTNHSVLKVWNLASLQEVTLRKATVGGLSVSSETAPLCDPFLLINAGHGGLATDRLELHFAALPVVYSFDSRYTEITPPPFR